MEQNQKNNVVKKVNNQNDSSVIRFDKTFMKSIKKHVDKANKKQFGKIVRAKHIITHLVALADNDLINKAIQYAQEDSLSLSDKKDLKFKENMSKFGGSREKYEEKMMELMDQFLLQNQ